MDINPDVHNKCKKINRYPSDDTPIPGEGHP